MIPNVSPNCKSFQVVCFSRSHFFKSFSLCSTHYYTLTIIQASRRALKHRERLHFFLVLLGGIMPLVYSTVSALFSRSIYNKLRAIAMLMQEKFRTSVYTFFDYRWLCAYKQRSTSEKHWIRVQKFHLPLLWNASSTCSYILYLGILAICMHTL